MGRDRGHYRRLAWVKTYVVNMMSAINSPVPSMYMISWHRLVPVLWCHSISTVRNSLRTSLICCCCCCCELLTHQHCCLEHFCPACLQPATIGSSVTCSPPLGPDKSSYRHHRTDRSQATTKQTIPPPKSGVDYHPLSAKRHDVSTGLWTDICIRRSPQNGKSRRQIMSDGMPLDLNNDRRSVAGLRESCSVGLEWGRAGGGEGEFRCTTDRGGLLVGLPCMMKLPDLSRGSCFLSYPVLNA
ncbi:hypothetical protein ASPBRDRAFT_255669 [Aspergillus brasiliensis CBS 101740]|uniref:Uncharacterized protein n=1 Tax=Aspergillus brasiliensis (strain CBS 101740 / IMI 381727 / IBT 21946) TaxID=767769 RepID=A0A1L9V2K6_ASPBC|nr:hypothetical protein ASPBRDRAFT_255669 [Aspergillus brasiliensis CBS 101740]